MENKFIGFKRIGSGAKNLLDENLPKGYNPSMAVREKSVR